MILVPAGVLGSAMLRFMVPVQGLAALTNGTDSMLSDPRYFVGLEALTLSIATEAGMIGFWDAGSGVRMALLPRTLPGGGGLALGGRL